jgi:hypothetical protein
MKNITIRIKEFIFDEMVGQINEEFGLETDAVTLQENFEESLMMLKGQLDPDNNKITHDNMS